MEKRDKTKKEIKEETTAALLSMATSVMGRARGLLFTDASERTLLLLPCNDIHTVGMRKPIDVAFVDTNGLVIASSRKLGSMRRLRNKDAVAVIERFANNDPWFELGDRLVISKLNSFNFCGEDEK